MWKGKYIISPHTQKETAFFFIYTEDRAKNEAKPVYASDADIVVTAESNLLTVDFPQAVGETVQYSVNLRRASDRSIVNRVVTWSKNIFHCPPPRLSVTFDDVEPGDYLVDVRPRAPFGTQGEAIEASFHLTQDAEVV